MKIIKTTELERNIVFNTLESFMTVSGNICFLCDEDSILAFVNTAMVTLESYSDTPARVPEMKTHALHLIASAFENFNKGVQA